MKSRRGGGFVLLSILSIAVACDARAQGNNPSPSNSPVAPTRDEALDMSLKPDAKDSFAETFREMGVIQRKAMNKSHRFLFSTFGSFDFSDGPYTLYSLNTNPGYALTDFWEVYLNVAPLFISQPREIVKKVNSLTLANGQTATIVSPKAKMQYGIEFLWAPLYGKDSLGIRHIIRSDTFLKFGAAQIKYETGTGMRFVLGLGKTFFLGPGTGLRFVVNGGYVQTVLDDVKAFRLMALIETGLVFYL